MMDEAKILELTQAQARPEEVKTEGSTLGVESSDIIALEEVFKPKSASEKAAMAKAAAWARENGAQTAFEVRDMIRSKLIRLGHPKIGDSRLTQFTRWLAAYRGFNAAVTHLEEVERGRA